MKDIIHFTNIELQNKFPQLHFDFIEENPDHLLIKITKGHVSNSVSVTSVIQHYWNTYDSKVAKRVWFEVENHSMDNENVVGETYQPEEKH